MAKKSSVGGFRGVPRASQEGGDEEIRSHAIWREAVRREMHVFVDQLLDGPKTARQIDGWAKSTIEGIANVIVAAMPAFDHIIGLEVARIGTDELDLLHTLSAPTNRSRVLHQKHAPWTSQGFDKRSPIARGAWERRMHRLIDPQRRRTIIGRLLRELANDSGLPGLRDLADDLVGLSAGHSTDLLAPAKGKKRKAVAYHLHRVRLGTLAQREFLLELGCLEGNRTRFNEAFSKLFAVSESFLATWRPTCERVFGAQAVAAKLRQAANDASRCKELLTTSRRDEAVDAQLHKVSRTYNESALEQLAIEHRLLVNQRKYEIRTDRDGNRKFKLTRIAIEDVSRRFPEIGTAYRRCGFEHPRYDPRNIVEPWSRE